MLLFLVSGSLAFFTDFYQNVTISSLSEINEQLKSELVNMDGKLAQIEGRVKELEREDDHLRIIADLPKIDDDTRNVGVGGVIPVNFEFPVVSKEVADQVMEYQEVLDKMERRLALTRHSRDEIRHKIEHNKVVMKHTPSIRPLLGGRIKDKFGFRIHPLLEKVKHHKGIDIAAERGTEVFATAAGKVEKVVTDYKKNHGWGKYVIIDHGFGIKTLYGHLSKVLVQKGQKTDRWKAIGMVGDTGLATGAHLHYEVRKDGQAIDPLAYILN
ncbi:MAG: M23 family metallopeptidase [bacterium]